CLDQFEAGPGELYLVMERAPGLTLKELAARDRFDEPLLRDVMQRTLEILVYLHGRSPPVIHRDLKPANLLRADDGAISLVDFGGVRDVLRLDGGSTVVGTFGYMAPEQLHGQATAATDLYGLGATVVALAGGVEPEDVPRRGLRMDVARHLPQLSPPLLALLEKMLAPNPEERLQSAKEALAILQNPERAAAAPRLGRRAERKRQREAARARVTEPSPELDAMPMPVRGLLRVLLITIGALGYAGLTVLDVAFLPFVFALVRAFSKDDRRPKLDEVQDHLHGALDEGKRGFHRLQGRVLRGRRALPPRRNR
ncbi:MAG TPA: protein kinase, partial [Polyangia bacterium]